ncbi:MAG: rhomboid family intramembrane serine protease [Alphaproteobacteria bacterium]|nr:rhomboid family intramembrane serine protease [Alphaproteobacteria bacterium]
MFLPLHDNTPLKVIRFQYVTLAIILINVAIFLYTGPLGNEFIAANAQGNFGLVPNELLHPQIGHGMIAEPLTLLTYLFLHGGWMHLIGNMLFLWVFADNIEDAYGPIGFAIFYLLCGVLGGLTHVFMMPNSPNPLIGASAAVSGILAAYILLFPKARVWILLFFRIPVPLPAFVVLGGWFLMQVFYVAAAKNTEDIAWWAHIGGFVAGLVITFLLRNRLQIQPNGRI